MYLQKLDDIATKSSIFDNPVWSSYFFAQSKEDLQQILEKAQLKLQKVWALQKIRLHIQPGFDFVEVQSPHLLIDKNSS